MQMHEFGVSPEHHAKFKEKMLAAAEIAVAEFPEHLRVVRDLLQRKYPPQVLAAFTAYGLQIGLADDGAKKKIVPDVMQHHAELLQAILLTVPKADWGSEPTTPKVTDALFKDVPKLANTFFMQRILGGSAADGNKEAMAVRVLQERIRLHTHGVRNWGYYDQVVRQCRELYSALDAKMQQALGFAATHVIDVLAALVSQFEKRQAAHWDILGRVVRARKPKQVLETYFRLVPGLQGTAEQILSSLPTAPTRENAIAMVMAHFDFRLEDTCTFSLGQIVDATGLPSDVVLAVMTSIAFSPGALVDAKVEFLFMENPVWDRPAILLGELYFCPIPQMAFSHIHRLMDRLSGEAQLLHDLKERRASFLEGEIEKIFRTALPGSDIRPSLKWKQGRQQFENDLVVIIDQVVLIVEAKSHRLTAQGLRGAPDRVKRHIREMVLEPSIQSSRLEANISAARAGNTEALKILASIGIDPNKASKVIRLSVTLDDFSILTTAEQELKNVGWVPRDHALAPAIHLADLRCVADILDGPLLLLHYLSERSFLQQNFNLHGDELDLLGLYLTSGFNLDELRGKFSQFSPTGMSEPIDRYYQGLEAGLRLKKPTVELRPLYRSIIDRISEVRPPTWTLIGLHLLSSADPAEQRAIEHNLIKLRAFVRRNYRDPEHVSTLVIDPPDKRKATIMFHLFPEALRAEHKETMLKLGQRSLEADDRTACVVFARGTESWGRAFESALLIQTV